MAVVPDPGVPAAPVRHRTEHDRAPAHSLHEPVAFRHTRSAKQRCRKKREEENSMHYAKTKRRRKGPAGRTANAEGTMKHPASNDPHHDSVQGEGNYEAAREFNEAERKFVQSGKVDAAARAAAPKDDAESQQLLDAEQKAKSRAKEDYPPPPEARPRGTDAAGSEPSKDSGRRSS